MGAKILSRNEIIYRVKSGDIKISYYCLSAGNPIKGGNHLVTYNPKLGDNDDGQSDAWKLFLDNLEEDSLRLCVGPYALIEHRTLWRRLWDWVFKRRKFSTRKGQDIFNLLENPSGLCLYPHENIVIGTNESITLKNKIGGSLFSTVKNTDVGLPHISTTIDPGWSGRLQIGLVNPTRTLKKLDLMESICKVRFHEHDVPCDPRSVTKKTHALEWKKIEDDVTQEFFPRRKESIIKQELIKFETMQALEFSATYIVPLLIGIWGIHTFIQNNIQRLDDFDHKIEMATKDYNHKIEMATKDYNNRIDLISKDIDLGVKNKIAGFEKKLDCIPPALNEKESTFEHQIINVAIGQDKQTISVSFERKYHAEPHVFVVFDNADNNKIKYKVQIPPQVKNNNAYYNSANITITPKNLKRFKEQNLNLHVFIVP